MAEPNPLSDATLSTSIPSSPSPSDPWDVAASFFEPKVDYSTDPVAWGTEVLHEFYWSKQREILESLRKHRYTAVQSCHDAGKSFIAARAAAHWIDSYPEGEAFVVSTAPTAAQVSAILWREIQRAHRKGGLRGSIAMAGYPQWKIGGELVGYGRKPADYSDAAFQGIHALFPLIVMDEGSGIPKSLFDAADALATNEFARVLLIGNPDDPTSHMAEVCKPDSGWNVIRIDGLLTPNFTRDRVLSLTCEQCQRAGATETLLARLFREEGLKFTTEQVPDDLRPRLLSPLWVEERLHRWVGRPSPTQTVAELASQSALFTAKVRGEFPTSSSEGVIPLGWVERAMQRWRDWVDSGRRPLHGRRVLGVDVARSGEDETAIAIRQGSAITEIRKHKQADTMEVTGFVRALLNDPDTLPVIDVIGIGAGVVDRLREQGNAVIAFNAAGSAKGMRDRSNEFGFINLRSAAWWNLREMLDPSRGFAVMLPDSEMLKADLTAPHWKVRSGGVIQVEGKDEIRKRLGRSTDEGDSVVQAFWMESDTSGSDEGAVSWWSSMSKSERDNLADTALDWLSGVDLGDPASW